jgi:hypothetical protein
LALALVYAALALAPVFWLALAGWAWSAGVTWLALGLAGCALVALLVPVGCLLRNRFAPRSARPALRRIGAPGEVRQRAA